MLYRLIVLFLLLLTYIEGSTQKSCGGGKNDDPPGCPGCGGTTSPTPPTVSIPVVNPKDPNEIIGPKGYDSTIKWVSVKDNLPYKILFENDPDFATAPAQKVIIYMPIHPKLNPNALRIGDFGFGNLTFTVPPNTTAYTQRLDVRDSVGVFVDVTAGLDFINRRAFWIFQSIDPATGLSNTLPANAGFLPVNDSTEGNGEGYVTLTIQPVTNAQTRDSISATADIIFDINEPLATNIERNTIDAFAPVSKIDTAIVNQTNITLQWSGQDDTGGSGVRDYAIYVSENGGPFKLYKEHLTDLSTTFTGIAESNYCFYSIATDNTGNKENLKNNCEFSTGSNLPITWLYFKGQQQANDVLLTWATVSEKNSKEFIIERSLDGRQFAAIGNVAATGNSNLTNNYNYTDFNAILLQAKVLYYRLKQVDKDGKFMYSITVAIPIQQREDVPITVKAYPNPFTQTITLEILNVTSSGKKDRVELYSLEGKLLYKKRIVNLSNATVLLNDLPQLTQGVYLLKTVIDKKLFTIKMVRQ